MLPMAHQPVDLSLGRVEVAPEKGQERVVVGGAEDRMGVGKGFADLVAHLSGLRQLIHLPLVERVVPHVLPQPPLMIPPPGPLRELDTLPEHSPAALVVGRVVHQNGSERVVCPEREVQVTGLFTDAERLLDEGHALGHVPSVQRDDAKRQQRLALGGPRSDPRDRVAQANRPRGLPAIWWCCSRARFALPDKAASNFQNPFSRSTPRPERLRLS